MTEELVTEVVAVLFLARGREVTEALLALWRGILAPFGDGPDALEVAADTFRAGLPPDQYPGQLLARRRQAAERARDRERLAALPVESEVPVPPEEARRRFAEMASRLGLRDRAALAVDDERRPTLREDDQLARLGVRRCVEPACGRFTSRADRRCLVHVYADAEEEAGEPPAAEGDEGEGHD